MILKKYIGSKEFYKNITIIAIPLALAELLQNCMSIIDTIMVSSIGMVTAVGNATNIISLHNLISWGIMSGIGCFSAQFYGAGQKNNFSKTCGLSIILNLLLVSFSLMLVYGFGEKVLLFYLNDISVVENSLNYLKIAIWMFVPLAFSWPFSMMYRSMGKTRLPFVVSTIVSLTNVFLNYFFIYKFNWGIKGAAYATLISQCIALILYVGAIAKDKPEFITNFKTMFSVDLKFIKVVAIKTYPVLLNETIFGFGLTLINKAFGLLGTEAMDAYYIAMEVFNFFTFIIWGYGAAVSIVIGQTLGKGEIEKAKELSNYIFGYSLLISLTFAVLVCVCAPKILNIFSFNNEMIYDSAIFLLYVFGLKLFIRNLNYTMFSTLKAGGDTRIVSLLDSGIQYLVGIVSLYLALYLGVKNIVFAALIEQSEQLIRYIFTRKRYKSGLWANDMTRLVI